MTARDFCFWLQGFFELESPVNMNTRQIELIERHLALVFKHEIDPAIDAKRPDMKTALDQIHQGGGPGGVVMRC